MFFVESIAGPYSRSLRCEYDRRLLAGVKAWWHGVVRPATQRNLLRSNDMLGQNSRGRCLRVCRGVLAGQVALFDRVEFIFEHVDVVS